MYLLRRPLKAHPYFFYSSFAHPRPALLCWLHLRCIRWLWTPIPSKSATLPTLLAIVMFIGCLGKEQALYVNEADQGRAFHCRHAFSAWAHGRVPRLLLSLGCSAIRASTVMLHRLRCVAVALFVLLALLGVTSLGIVKRAMSSRRWTRGPVLRLEAFCPSSLMFRSAWRCMPAQESLLRRMSGPMEYCVWAKPPQSATSKRGNATGAPREEETSIGDAHLRRGELPKDVSPTSRNFPS